MSDPEFRELASDDLMRKIYRLFNRDEDSG
jgi:hypothetical protein